MSAFKVWTASRRHFEASFDALVLLFALQAQYANATAATLNVSATQIAVGDVTTNCNRRRSLLQEAQGGNAAGRQLSQATPSSVSVSAVATLPPGTTQVTPR